MDLEAILREILDLIALGRYSDALAIHKHSRLTSSDLRNAIRDYPFDLTICPANAFDLASIVEIPGTINPQWSIAIPMWTKQEGRSDLTLEVSVTREGPKYIVELDDLHVL